MVTRTKKIFVGGLSAATTLEEVKAYFQRFGEVSSSLTFSSVFLHSQLSLGTNQLPLFQIEDAMLMHDKQTNRHRWELLMLLMLMLLIPAI